MLRKTKGPTRYLVIVEDAATPHLADIQASSQCGFGRAWKAFNQQHQGRSHRTLSWCRWLLGVFLLVGAAAVYAVRAELLRPGLGCGGPQRFHLIVAAKFVLLDVPQQVCIVLYLLGWYEASGLRCQLCLFEPRHCVAESAFHTTNLLAILCTLLSSTGNQLLIRPTFKRSYSEDDICMQYLVRIGGLCIAVLPFTTGVCVASRSLLPLPTFLHLLCAVPCGVGWLTIVGFFCVPLVVCCDEECDL